jgi:hypothetical protein
MSETSASFYDTAFRNIPEDSHLHFHRRENLKYHHPKSNFGFELLFLSPVHLLGYSLGPQSLVGYVSSVV